MPKTKRKHGSEQFSVGCANPIDGGENLKNLNDTDNDKIDVHETPVCDLNERIGKEE